MSSFSFSVSDPPSSDPDAIAVLCLVDGPGATWRLSFELPLRRQREAGHVRFVCLEEKAFDRLQSRDVAASVNALLAEVAPAIVVLSRCNSFAAILLVEAAAARGLPVIYHIDDDLFAVPKELGKSKFDLYNSPARQAAFRTCCERAGRIYCSTKALALRVGRFGFQTPIVHGEIYCSAPEPYAPYRPSEPPVIGYMGTAGHKADLEGIVPAVIAIMTDHAELSFEVFGTLDAPEQLKQVFPDRVRHRPPIADYDAFLDGMRTLRWAVALAPLKDIPFNATKANTKFIEYTLGGMPAVVSQSQVYTSVIAGGAGLAATSMIEWIEAIDRLLRNPEEAGAQVERAQARLRKDYPVEKLEGQVLDILSRAIEDKKRASEMKKPARRPKEAIARAS